MSQHSCCVAEVIRYMNNAMTESDWRTRSFRIPDRVFDAARRIARRRGENVSTVIRRALIAYVDRHGDR
jgi:hypothetical protein